MKYRMIALAALATLAACGADSVAGPSGNVSGVWNGRTVNGQALPSSVSKGNSVTTYTSVFLTARGIEAGTFTREITYRYVDNVQQFTRAQTNIGTWFSKGGSITFTDANDRTYAGSVTHNSLTEIIDGVTFTYSR